MEININGMLCDVSCNEDIPALENWHPRLAYLFLSLKNPHFTKELIIWFIEVCQTHFERGIICIVDEPYYHNLAADFEMEQVPPEHVDKLKKYAHQKQSMVQKCLNTIGSLNVQLAPWFLLSLYTPQWMKDEIRSAFQLKGLFYNQVLHQVSISRRVSFESEKLEHYAEFVLSELPVLSHAFYALPQGVVDFYPGEDSSQFYDTVKSGLFANELPKITKFIQSSKPLIYANVLGVRREGDLITR